MVATVLTVYGIETVEKVPLHMVIQSCNSAYRLRYWNLLDSRVARQLLDECCNSAYRLRYWNPNDIKYNNTAVYEYVATVLTVYGIETLQ